MKNPPSSSLRAKRGNPVEKGFTLLELLVVMAILSAVALAAFDMTGVDRAQARMDDTQTRLGILRRAILGLDAPAWGGEVRLSGFVADNGRLPEHLRELIQPEELFQRSGIRAEFSASLDGNCFPVGTTSAPGGNDRLIKGHRGAYLTDAAQGFRDGWGNVGQDDSLNFGWEVTRNDTDLLIASLGADNGRDDLHAPTSEAEKDQSTQIAPGDWRVPFSGWQITLRHSGPAPLYADTVGLGNDFGKLGASLLVFVNNGTDGHWQQYRSDSNSCPTGTDRLESGEECVLSFSDSTRCAPGQEIPNLVPLGRHVLVITTDHALTDRRLVNQIDFFPGATQPNLVLEMY